MKTAYRMLSVLLIIILLSSSCLTGCSFDKKSTVYKDIGQSAVLDSTKENLPDRPYVLASEVNIENQTLQDLLVSENVSLKTLMLAPKFESSILSATSLTALIHSKAEMQGLKALEAEIEFLLDSKNSSELMSYTKRGMTSERLKKLDAKLKDLFSAKGAAVSVYNGPIKGTWTTPDRIILRWTPQNEWIPLNGYNLFRTINGQTEKIASGLGSELNISQFASKNFSFSEAVKPLYEKAALDDNKLKQLGYATVKDFNMAVYGRAKVNSEKIRIPGATDFKLSMNRLLTIPADINGKVPVADAYSTTAVHMAKNIEGAISALNVEKTSIKTARLQHAMSSVQNTIQDPKSSNDIIVNELMDARNTIVTKTFLDSEFADVSGFGYEDNLEGKEIETNALVKYVVVPAEGNNASLTAARIASGTAAENAYSIAVKYGVETPVEVPEGFEGYGMDNLVPMRWNAPVSDYARTIISGYNIERKKKDETEFKKINETPVAISYATDENGILFETASFYEDRDLKNGEEATYRLQALDIFGRVSEYSTSLDIKVNKIAAPQVPIVGEPDLSTKVVKERAPASYPDIISYNKGKKGVILPITRGSNDTQTFVIYRSKALGTGFFGTPEELVRINVAPYMQANKSFVASNKKKGLFLLNPKTPAKTDTIYFDNTIDIGYYYKYWVSAVDSWGNESIWSESKIIGYPLGDAPKEPIESSAAMERNSILKDGTKVLAPGFYSRYTMTVASVSNTSNQVGNVLINNGLQNYSNTANGGNSQQTAQNQIGYSVSQALHAGVSAPLDVSLLLNNLPKAKDVHDMIVLDNEDILPDGSVEVPWYHYAGDGISGYTVYRAYVDGKSLADVTAMSKESMIQSFAWKLVGENVQVNQFTEKVDKKDGRLYVYLVCLIPKEKEEPVLSGFNYFIPAGWIQVNWKRPEDPQVSYYRVYRAEVPYFKENQDMKKLDWLMVGDNLKYSTYSEKVDQTFAHYYYFKVMSVSTWGVESEAGSIAKYRVPATVAPQAPSMLVPFSKKETNQVNWAGVPHASKYEIYRLLVPRIQEEDLTSIQGLAPDLFSSLFNPQLVSGIYFSNPNKLNVNLIQKNISLSDAKTATGNTVANKTTAVTSKKVVGTASAASTGKFKTLQLKKASVVKNNIKNMTVSDKLSVFSGLVDKYGPLAVAPFGALDYNQVINLSWTKVGEVTIPQGEDSTGEKSFTDKSVVFGNTYLYTVQAWNDDNLGSDTPEPVSVFTRKGKPFPVLTNVRWERAEKKPVIMWNAAKDPNLSLIESQEYIAGYIVYRSNTQKGDYYQASGLIPNDQTSFKDVNANLSSDNWYKVRVVDTAGYISDFSAAVNAKIETKTAIPNNEIRSIPMSSPKKVGSSTSLNTGVLDLLSLSAAGSLTNVATIISKTPAPIIIKPSFKPIIITTPTPTTVNNELNQRIVTPTPGATPSPYIPPVTIRPRATSTPLPNARTTPSTAIIKPSTGMEIAPGTFIAKTMTLNGFTISDISIAGKKQGSGEGVLNIQGGIKIPVYITINAFRENIIINGYASQKGPVTIGDTGVFFKTINLKTSDGTSLVSGYVKRTSGNMMGDMLMLELDNCSITPGGIINVGNIPVFHYQNLTFTGVSRISINLNQYANTGIPTTQGGANGINITNLLTTGTGFINLHDGTVETSMGLETIDNKGFEYTFGIAGFDAQGRLSGNLKLNGEQYIRTVIPAGLGIKAKSSALVYIDGSVEKTKSFIKGKVLTPFGTFEDETPVNPELSTINRGGYMSLQDVKTLVNANSSSSGNLTTQQMNILNSGIYYMAEQAQTNALLVAPEATADDAELASSAPFTVSQWDGNGFVINDTTMTPTDIGRSPYSFLSGESYNDSIGATPGKVALDLTRSAAYTGKAPEDVKIADWMGIVVKYGNVSLPPDYVKTEQNGRVRFNLTAGELLYDQNGFCYQNQAYTPEGVPVNFGDALGGFTDVVVYNIVMDLYNNKTNLQVDGDMVVPLFNSRLKVKLYTDEKVGKLVCTVGETDKLDPSGKEKVKIKILGGYLNEQGLHVDGTLDFAFEENLKFTDVQFNELIIPSDMKKLETEDKNSIYGHVLFDKPYLIEFHDFPMEIRALSMTSKKTIFNITNETYSGIAYNTTMTFWGGMQLSDNLPADANEDVDRIIIGKSYSNPTIVYNESKSKINMDFEDFAQFKGVGTPKVTNTGDGIVEYDTEGLEMAFNGAMDMTNMPIQVNARIGFDKVKDRSFFAVAIFYGSEDGGPRPPGIPFGFGEINDMTGVIGYNLDMPKNADGTFNIPREKTGVFNAIDTMPVDRSSGGNYFFALTATMYLGYNDLCLGQVRNLYLVVEKGPTVELGGYYFGPTTIDGFTSTDGGKLKEMGTARMGYYHQQRLFKFSLSLYDFGMYGFDVSGDIGFDMCPDYWELRVGYPNALRTSLMGFADSWFGFAIRDSDIDESYVKAQSGFSYDTGDITLGIVYIRGYLAIWGDGIYVFDNNYLELNVHLRGGIQGGVKALGKRFNVISLMLEANGTLKNPDSWHLNANATIRYHVDLWLKDIGGSVSWGISKTF